MKLNSINIGSIIPVEYNHMHDGTLLFRKYRENFDFGLTIDQYYINQTPQDKKTNYNTQYTITDLHPLSALVELDIPYTASATKSFTTTIKNGDKYLKTNFSDTDNVVTQSATETQYTAASGLDSSYFFNITFQTSNLGTANRNEERIVISQDYYDSNNNTTTFYLSAPSAHNTNVFWTSALSTDFRFSLDNNTLLIYSSRNNIGVGTTTVDNVSGNVAVLQGSNFFWNEPGTWQSTISDLTAAYFNINRNILTKNYKSIPNSYVKYVSSYNTDTVDLNTSTITDYISNNYFVYSSNYNFFHEKDNIGDSKKNTLTVHADLFPLKNQATLHEYYAENNHFNSEPGYLNRVYEKIHAGTNQQHGTEKVGLSYNIGTYDIVFKPNKLTYFTTPNSIAPYTVLNIKDSKIDTIGSVAGDNPLLSDKVFKRREDVKNNSYSNDTNPTYLCSWLSGNADGNRKWVDRYYNPTIKNFNNALSATSHFKVVTGAGAETTETFDVSSSLTFEPNNDYMLYHIGRKDYEALFEAYDTPYNEASKNKIEYLNYKGVPTTVNKSLNDDEIIFDGETFSRFKAEVVGDFSVNFWLDSNDNKQPKGYMILGNYFEEGFGVFNTDLVTPNIILPALNPKSNLYSKLLFLNNDFEVYDEVILKDGVTEISIKGIGRKDNFSEFYVLGTNNIIYVFNSNNNLISKIENLKDATGLVDDFEVGEDRVHVLFNPVSKLNNYFTYNPSNNKANSFTDSVSSDTKGEKGKIVRRDGTTSVYSVDSVNGFGNEIAIDSNGKAYTVRQEYKNNVGHDGNYVQKNSSNTTYTSLNKIKSGLGKDSRSHGVVLDDEDNIIILHDGNIISILDNNRKLKRTREFCNLNNANFQQSYIDLIYDFEDGVYKKYILLIQEFNSGFRLTKLNDNLQIISSKKFFDQQLADLNFTKSVTSYYYLKNNGANKNRIKVVLKAKPKFSSSGVIPKQKFTIDFNLETLNPGYNHFYINVSMRKGYMELYVNGKLYEQTKFTAGRFALDNVLGSGCYIGAVSTPFYLTLANRLLQPKKYFLKDIKIKGFKLYNKTMSYFDILAHYNYHIGDKDLIWSYPIGQRTYIDTIDKLMKFTLPEKINNKYTVNINNTSIADDKLKNKLHEKISKELEKITPYFDTVENINIT